MSPVTPHYRLNDGLEVPAIGFGTYPLTGADGIAAIRSALENGYRLLDTAVNYGNEEDVGEAVRQSGIPRDEVLIATKIPGRFHRFDLAVRSVEESLGRLGVDRIDLALIHWPNPSIGLYEEAWKGLVEVRDRGWVRSIGVSNFTEAHLRRIIDATGVTPSVNQIELHPRFTQERMRRVNEELGIRTCAWSPLGKRNAPYEEPAVAAAASTHAVEPAQVILRWHFQLGSLPLPKSADPQRQRVNLDVFDFELTEEEMAAVSALDRPDGRLFGGDPDHHEEM